MVFRDLANFEENRQIKTRQYLNNVLFFYDYVCACACEREQCEFRLIGRNLGVKENHLCHLSGINVAAQVLSG